MDCILSADSTVKPDNRWSLVEWEAFTDKILHAVLLPGQHWMKAPACAQQLCSCRCFSWANQNIPSAQTLTFLCWLVFQVSSSYSVKLQFLWDAAFSACCSPDLCHCCDQLQKQLLCSSLKVAVSLHASRVQNRESPDNAAQKALWEHCGMKGIPYSNVHYWTGN